MHLLVRRDRYCLELLVPGYCAAVRTFVETVMTNDRSVSPRG
nr:hypothetical protein [Kibdelosporangium sp. MJ126-NF4]CTQ96977.1 hypothetical protein [Kibdelosporangium sp. MJ126-NF4]